MGIERDRIGLPETGEQLPRRRRENGKGAITPIHMHPELEAVGNFPNLSQRIDRARIHRPGIRHHAEWEYLLLSGRQ